MYRNLPTTIASLLLLVAASALADGGRNVPLYVMTGVKANLFCSELFVSKRPRKQVEDEFRVQLEIYDVAVDEQAQKVTLSVGNIVRMAEFRSGLGCTLSYDGDAEQAMATQPVDMPALPARSSGYQLPRHENAALLASVDSHLEFRIGADDTSTRALLVLLDGKVAGDRYLDGFDANTRFNGFSLGKGVMNALLGIAVQEEMFDVHSAPVVAKWADAADSRSKITADHLLRMTAGLQWREGAGQSYTTDVYVMLAGKPDTFAYASSASPRAGPGERWRYSTGNTQILSQALREAVNRKRGDYHAFPKQYLFDPLGMDSAIVEVDSAGTFLLGALMYASATDWAKLGQLYLQDGIWQGKRLLPEGWVNYTLTPTVLNDRHIDYGAHFWLAPAGRFGPNTPKGAYYLRGYEDQYLMVVPSLRLVVVRMGKSCLGQPWEAESLMQRLIEIVKTADSVNQQPAARISQRHGDRRVLR